MRSEEARATCCPICGARLAPDGACRFAVPAEEAPWLAWHATAERADRESGLPLARWLLHHPDDTDPSRVEWARRTAGVEPDPG